MKTQNHSFSWVGKLTNILFIIMVACSIILLVKNVHSAPITVTNPITATEVSNAANDPISTIMSASLAYGSVFTQISQAGLWNWFKANIIVAILLLVGAARVIIVLTPTREDDKFWNKYLYTPIRSAVSFLQLNERWIKWILNLFKK